MREQPTSYDKWREDIAVDWLTDLRQTQARLMAEGVTDKTQRFEQALAEVNSRHPDPEDN